mmetsp:Transcript_25392/g.42548  ORF Transcript_25392/g.42548 Transcript_25392/m.42548 type:complete len:218 (+) Transcript_25392:2630-3283(+)
MLLFPLLLSLPIVASDHHKGGTSFGSPLTPLPVVVPVVPEVLVVFALGFDLSLLPGLLVFLPALPAAVDFRALPGPPPPMDEAVVVELSFFPILNVNGFWDETFNCSKALDKFGIKPPSLVLALPPEAAVPLPKVVSAVVGQVEAENALALPLLTLEVSNVFKFSFSNCAMEAAMEAPSNRKEEAAPAIDASWVLVPAPPLVGYSTSTSSSSSSSTV